MNIMVFDVPAESGGALSILNDFYKKVLSSNDENINWIFVISKPILVETENIKVLRFPWIKKSWGHRLYFNHFIAPKLVKEHKADKIFSLQNVIIPHTDIEQILYVHNSLPFIGEKFALTEDSLLWIYQNIIGRLIIKSIKKAYKVIVQAEWLKQACIEKTGVEEEKIAVFPPEINIETNRFFEASEQSLSTFFYPASGVTFKNHKVIVEACKILKGKRVNDHKIIFTLKGNENRHISKLYNEVKKQKLPIEFVGQLSKKQVFGWYTRSILLFPSYVETYGLPMLEAKIHKGVIFASDCLFSHEILDGYENAAFFDPFNADELAKLLEKGYKYNHV